MRIDRKNLENADLVLTTNQSCCDFIKSRYNVKRVVHLKGGINTDIDGLESDLDPDELTTTKERSKDILFIGRGVHKRGVDILMRAFKIFNERRECEFRLHIVGVRPEELPKELQPVDSTTLFYGYLDRNVLEERVLYRKLLRSAKMFVFPMRPGPVAGVLWEAQLYCTPLITSNFSEVVTHGYNGIVVDHLDPSEFARQMAVMVDDTSRWRQMARNAHESIRGCTWDNTIKNLLDIASETGLVAAKSSRAPA
jgi:glycosyltransferase involved in cell wall biosynthesis